MTKPNELPAGFINWRHANQHQEANAENQQRAFLHEHLKRKELMESLQNHSGWQLVASFLASKLEEATREAEGADNPHQMATNLMLAKSYRALLRFPADTIAMAESLAETQAPK